MFLDDFQRNSLSMHAAEGLFEVAPIAKQPKTLQKLASEITH